MRRIRPFDRRWRGWTRRARSRASPASFRYPTISLDPIVSRQRTVRQPRRAPSRATAVQGSATISDWLVPVDLTYEVDVWGRVRRSLQAARAQARAAADDEAVIRLAVQTDVAQFYYTLRLLDAQLDILAQTISSYREQVRLLRVQVRTGLVSAIVLNQAEAQLQSTLAQQQDVARARADQEHALAILCGRPAPAFSVPRQSVGRGYTARCASWTSGRCAQPPSGRRRSRAEPGGGQRPGRRRDG